MAYSLSVSLQYVILFYAYLGFLVWMIGMVAALVWRNFHRPTGSSSSPKSSSFSTLEPRIVSLSDVLAWRSLILWLLPLTFFTFAIVLNEFWRYDVRLFGYYPLGLNPLVMLVLVHEAAVSIWALSLVWLWCRLRIRRVQNAAIYVVIFGVFLNMMWLIPQLFPNHLYSNDVIYRSGHLHLPVSTTVSIVALVLALVGAVGSLGMSRYKMYSTLKWWMLALTVPLIVVVWFRREYMWYGFVVDAILMVMIIGCVISLEKMRLRRRINTDVVRSLNESHEMLRNIGLFLLFCAFVLALFVVSDYIQGLLMGGNTLTHALYDVLIVAVLSTLLYMTLRFVFGRDDALGWASVACLSLLAIDWFPSDFLHENRMETGYENFRLHRARYLIAPAGIVALVGLSVSLALDRGRQFRPFLVGLVWGTLFTFWLSTDAIDPASEHLAIHMWLIASILLAVVFWMMAWVFGPDRALVRRSPSSSLDGEVGVVGDFL